MKEHLVLRKEIKKVLNKLLLSVIIFLIGMILVKTGLKETIKTKLYEESLPFQKIKSTYKKYIGNITPIEETQPVFNETLEYNKIINSINNLYRDKTHLIHINNKYTTEKDYLNEMYRKV